MPRAYPEGLGQSLHDIYMEELKRPPRGDLRVNLTPDHEKSPVQLFTQLPLGDCWRDADLLPVFEYVYKCRHTRTTHVDSIDHKTHNLFSTTGPV